MTHLQEMNLQQIVDDYRASPFLFTDAQIRSAVVAQAKVINPPKISNAALDAFLRKNGLGGYP